MRGARAGIPFAATRYSLRNCSRGVVGTTVNRNNASPMFDFARRGTIKEIGLVI